MIFDASARTYLQPHYGNGVFWQCLPFSWTTLRGKHCRHPIAVMGVVDTFVHSPIKANLPVLLQTGGAKNRVVSLKKAWCIISCSCVPIWIYMIHKINELFLVSWPKVWGTELLFCPLLYAVRPLGLFLHIQAKSLYISHAVQVGYLNYSRMQKST